VDLVGSSQYPSISTSPQNTLCMQVDSSSCHQTISLHLSGKSASFPGILCWNVVLINLFRWICSLGILFCKINNCNVL